MPDIRIKRVYETIHTDDGFCVLIDRLWPRGVSREKLRPDLWAKSVAPSTALRKWFNHDRTRWQEFRKRYAQELDNNPSAISSLLQQAGEQRLTLLYSARDPKCNHALVLQEYLQRLTR